MSALSQIVLLVRCVLLAMARGKVHLAPKNLQVICVVQTAQLGDMICTTPLFRAIKKEYPESRLVLVGTKGNKALLEGNPDVDVYIAWDGSALSMAQKIKTHHPEFGCVVSPNFVGLAALFLAGVPFIVAPKVEGGTCPTETKSYKLLRLWTAAVSYNFYAYTPREYLRLLEPIGIHTEDTKKYLYYTNEAKNSSNQKLGTLAGSPFCIIAPGAGSKIKRWPSERFAQVAEYIAGKYMPVVVIGGPADIEEVTTMMSQVSSSQVLNLGGQLSVEELKALVGGASLFISSDTGPIYIAEALGVPTIDIVGPVSENTQPPRGPRNLVVVPERSRAEVFILNARVYDADETYRQATASLVEEVTRAVDTLLKKI